MWSSANLAAGAQAAPAAALKAEDKPPTNTRGQGQRLGPAIRAQEAPAGAARGFGRVRGLGGAEWRRYSGGRAAPGCGAGLLLRAPDAHIPASPARTRLTNGDFCSAAPRLAALLRGGPPSPRSLWGRDSGSRQSTAGGWGWGGPGGRQRATGVQVRSPTRTLTPPRDHPDPRTGEKRAQSRSVRHPAPPGTRPRGGLGAGLGRVTGGVRGRAQRSNTDGGPQTHSKRKRGPSGAQS